MKKKDKKSNYTGPHMGEMLRDVLAKHGYNPSSISDKVGVSRNTMSNACNSEIVSPNILHLVGTALGIDLYSQFYWADFADKMEKSSVVEEPSTSYVTKFGRVMVMLDLSDSNHLNFLRTFIPKSVWI